MKTTTPQKRGGREKEMKKSHYVLPVAFWTKRTQDTEIHAGVLMVCFGMWFISLPFFPQRKRFNGVPEF